MAARTSCLSGTRWLLEPNLVSIEKGVLSMSIWFCPFPAEATGPAGPPSALSVGRHSSPSTALKVWSRTTVKDNDLQWVHIPLSVPAGTKVRGVKFNYQVHSAATAGATFISQTRLTQ